MFSNNRTLVLLIFLLILLAACKQGALPTAVPVAAVPTEPPPTATTLPPTLDLTELAGTPAPTPIPPTRPPTATPTPVRGLINITMPDEDAAIVLGSDIVVRGLVQRETAHTVWLALVSNNGRLLAETEATVGEAGWEAGFTVPIFVSGAAFLQATVRDESGAIMALNEIPVNLVVDMETAGRYLTLSRPQQGETAVAGFNILFDGRVLLPANNSVTISIWSDECQTRVARQSFVLGQSNRSFPWQGFVVIPHNVTGPACAVAHFGTPGAENWREAQYAINILPPDEAEAKGIHIGNPPPGSTVTAGQELLIYGAALNVSEGPVQVSVLLENGRIVSQNTAYTDYWGYWETLVFLPADVEGAAEVTAAAGDTADGSYAETKNLITINPAPTPTPVP